MKIIKVLEPNKGLKVFDVKLEVTTAGPSPFSNKRTELFLLGCKKAMCGDACPGCFNSVTWDDSKAKFSHDPIELAAKLNEVCPNKYITIGGGQPDDQIDDLIILTKELKQKYNFHIMMYTWRDVQFILKGYKTKDSQNNNNKYFISPSKFKELTKYIDIIVDGEFDPEQCLYDDAAADGLISSIGSGNQKIWNMNNYESEYMRNLKSLELDEKNNLIFNRKE